MRPSAESQKNLYAPTSNFRYFIWGNRRFSSANASLFRIGNCWRSSVYHHRRVEGRMSSMAKKSPERIELLQGTLDMLILRTLLFGPSHGHQIGKHIQRTTNDVLQMQHGSLYPALHRLEKRGWVVSK